MSSVSTSNYTAPAPSFPSSRVLVTGLLLLLCFPWGWLRLRAAGVGVFWLGASALVGLPVFLVGAAFAGLMAFAACLPPLDLRVGDRADRTIRNNAGNYESTFLETARETGGAHELIRVQIQPGGGNFPHYHRTFEETFTTFTGALTVYTEAGSVVLHPGQTVTVPRGTVHWFRNESNELTEMTVRVTPAAGLEKSLRVTYGLTNTGGWGHKGMTKNPWHMPLLLGYSGTYLTTMPAIIQEPLVWALARIAQWRGEDEALKIFFA